MAYDAVCEFEHLHYAGFIERVLKEDLQCRSGRRQFDNLFLPRLEVLLFHRKDEVFRDLLNVEVAVLVAKFFSEEMKDLCALFVNYSRFLRLSIAPASVTSSDLSQTDESKLVALGFSFFVGGVLQSIFDPYPAKSNCCSVQVEQHAKPDLIIEIKDRCL